MPLANSEAAIHPRIPKARIPLYECVPVRGLAWERPETDVCRQLCIGRVTMYGQFIDAIPYLAWTSTSINGY